MFVGSYARLPSITVRDTTSVPLHYGSGPLLQCAVPSDPLLQCAVPPRYCSDPLLQCAVLPRFRSGPPLQCAVPPRYRSGPPLQCAARALHCNARCRLGTARALYYNARFRLGTASVPLGPSNARYRHPVWVLQIFNWIGVRNFQENTKTNGKPRNATLTV